MPTQINVCMKCTRLRLDRTCEAYSARIPDEIWDGRSAHVSLRGDEDLPRTLIVRSASDADYLRGLVGPAKAASIPILP
jgi:hypothetical protein